MKTMLRKVKCNKGSTDNGVYYDYTRIEVDAPIYEGQANEFGLDTLTLEFGKKDDFIKLQDLRGKLPCPVEVEWQTFVKGKNEVKVVTKLEVLDNKGKQQQQQAS